MSRPILSLVDPNALTREPRSLRDKVTLLGLVLSGLRHRSEAFLLENYELDAAEGLAMEIEEDLENEKKEARHEGDSCS